MRRLALLALALAACAGGPAAPSAPPAPRPAPADPAGAPVAVRAEPAGFPAGLGFGVSGAIAVRGDHPLWGGLSAIELWPDGERFIAVSDRGALFTGRLVREGRRLVGLADVRHFPITDPAGRPRPAGEDDAEAVALAPDGSFWIAFEGSPPRIWRYARPGAPAEPLALTREMLALQRNSGLEALALDHDGALLAIPERSGALERPFPVFRRDPETGRWDAGRLPRAPPHLVTGADVGPDGLLYVVERDFSLLGGFAVRVRRADLADWPDLRPETLFDSRGLDNLEGIAVWADPEGRRRMVLVSDDNFSPFQRTLFLEIALD